MKTKSIIAMSLMAALAAGCSSDDIVDDGGKNLGTIEGKSYVSMNITLPSTNGTRSVNDNFNAGDPDEYKVKSVKISFYTYEDNNYKHIDGADLNYSNEELVWAASSVTGVTTTALLPVKQVTFADNIDAFALVEVNPIEKDGWIVNPTNAAIEMTASDLTGKDEDNFFMTNTVWDDGHYMVPIKSFKSELDAQNHAKDYNIYVERAVAKATLSVATTENWKADSEEENAPKHTYAINDETNVYNGAKIKIAAWKLDVTNKKMYPIRKFAGTTSYANETTAYSRFYGAYNYGTKDAALYRTYWAQDPNYNDDDYTTSYTVKNAFDTITATTPINNAIDADEYCLENTFDTRHQKQNETTRVVVKAIYTPDGQKEGTWYALGNSTKAYSYDQVGTAIMSALDLKDDNAAKLATGLPAGTYNFSGSMIQIKKEDGTYRDANGDELEKVKTRLGKITTYENGVCYYAIRIKHLDNYCPWGEEITDPSITDKYVEYLNGDKEQSYLGRYGVVRNNWYQVTINSVSQPGSPTIPELTEEQDDVQKYYLQANINILDWAVRKQGVDL